MGTLSKISQVLVKDKLLLNFQFSLNLCLPSVGSKWKLPEKIVFSPKLGNKNYKFETTGLSSE